MPLKLFGVFSNRDIDHWDIIVAGKIGPVTLENKQQMKKHTDFVRDILVMKNDFYSLIATAGLDKQVHLWDLNTLSYKTTRNGHTAGVQCLAWDGKSVLCAGGFDYSIIGLF